MGIKEILAAKKAAADALAAKALSVEPTTTKVENATNDVSSAPSQPEILATPVSPLDHSSPVEKPAAPAVEKPLTFAEKMALKKAGVTAAQAVPQAPAKELGPVVIDASLIPENPEDAQAYVDIKTKIHNLEAMFDDDLKNAMSELKQALKKNPNATDLMLDADVGKMVTALRRMTHVAQVEATTKTKAGKTKTAVKLKDTPLTKEEIEAAFNDL